MWREFIIPLVVGGFGGWATIFFQRRAERRRRAEDVLFAVYMMLMDLKGRHFWIASAELRKEESPLRARQAFQDMRWRIADEVRKIDHFPEARELLRAMFSLTYKSERERADELDRLTTQLGQKVNPRYDAAMAEITHENQLMMVADFDEFWRRRTKLEPL